MTTEEYYKKNIDTLMESFILLNSCLETLQKELDNEYHIEYLKKLRSIIDNIVTLHIDLDDLKK